jgi:hypothetical protein
MLCATTLSAEQCWISSPKYHAKHSSIEPYSQQCIVPVMLALLHAFMERFEGMLRTSARMPQTLVEDAV